MRDTFKVLFYVNGSKEKDSIVPIMGRITVNGKLAQFSCKRTISLALWDAKGNKAKGKSDEAQRINRTLDKIKAQIIEHYGRIKDREGFVTAEMVKNAFQGIGDEYETLLSAFDKFISDFGKRVGKDRSASTHLKYRIVRRHLANFIKSCYKRNDMAMKELTEDFIRQFDIYLRTEAGLTQSGVWSYAIPLKMIVFRAHSDGYLHRNPFANYHISPNVRERLFLTEEELQTIMNCRFSKVALTVIRDVFVFGCFTGISFIDIRQLTTDNLENINGNWWIVAKRKKTKTPFRIKLLDIPLRIIERYEPFRTGKYLFRFGSNSRVNKMLKEIARQCSMEKNLTFHVARHTFFSFLLKTSKLQERFS